MEKYISNYTGEQIDTLLSQIQSNVSQADLDALKAELVLRLQGTSSSQDGYKDPVFYKEFVGSATLDDMNTWLDNQFFAIKDGVYYRNGQSGSYAISKDVPQCLINLSYQGIKIYVFNSPRSYATGTFEQFAIGAAVSGNGITWGSGIYRRKSTYNFGTKKATWTAWEKINSDVDKSYVDTQLAKKVDKVSGKGLSTNDYTTAEKNLVATISNKAEKTYVDTQLATKTSKEYVDNKVKEANANAANAAKIRTEDMQYMGVAFDSEERPTLRFRASEDPTSKNIDDTITVTDVAGSGADVSVVLKITEGQTIVVENSGMPAAVLLGLGGDDAKIVAKTQTDEVLCVYTCPLGDEFIYIYGISAKYRIYNSDLWRYLLSGKVADKVNECNILSTHTKLLGIGYKSLMSVNGEYVVNSVFNSVSVGSTLDIRTTTSKGGNMSGTITLEPGQTIAALEKAVIAKSNGSNFTVVAVCDESKFGYNDNKFTYFCNNGVNAINVAVWVNRYDDNIKYALYDNVAWELLAEKNIVSKINAKADTTYVNTQLASKVDKMPGMGLSDNNYTNDEKEKIARIQYSEYNCRAASVYQTEEINVGAYLPIVAEYRVGTAGVSGGFYVPCEYYVENNYGEIKLYMFCPNSKEGGSDDNHFIVAEPVGGSEWWEKKWHVTERYNKWDVPNWIESKFNSGKVGNSEFVNQKESVAAKLSTKADKTYVDEQLDTKVSKVAGKGLSTNDYTTSDKLIVATVPNKVDKMTGKGLSTNDFSNQYRGKVDEIYKLTFGFADITGLSYIYRVDESSSSLSSAQVGDTFRWYEDEDGRGYLANYHIKNGQTIKSTGYPILTYYSPDYFGVIAAPDETGICSYTYEGDLDWDDVYVHINSNPQIQVGTPLLSIDDKVKELQSTISTIIQNDEDAQSYGIQFDTSVSSPTCTRIGSPTLHKTLPIQSKMRGCLLQDDGTVYKYLNSSNWTTETRDGKYGQVMVEIPEHYRKCTQEGTICTVRLSELPIEGYQKIPKMYVSAYEASIQRSTGKLCSVVNTTTDYRGGNNTSAYDGTYRSLLGMPVTSLSRTAFRDAARKRKDGDDRWNMYMYHVHKAIFWLFATEYATLNSQAAYNAELTAEGYRQGGLGAGVTNFGLDWNAHNGYNPIIPCGCTDSLGNSTGEVTYNVMKSDGTVGYAAKVARYRGIENPFGHIWKWTDGINIEINPTTANGGNNLSKVYVREYGSGLSDTGYTGYKHVGNEARTDGYVKQIIFGNGGEIIPSVVNGSTTTYFCDYHWTTIPTTATLRGVLFGGHASDGVSAGLVSAYSHNAPSSASAAVGSRLCFLA